MKLITSKVLTLCVVLIAMLTLSTNDVLTQINPEDIDYNAAFYRCQYRAESDGCGLNCTMSCAADVQTNVPVCGSGALGSWSTPAFDWGLANGMTSDAILGPQITNVFFFEEMVDLENPIGWGYIGAVVMYNSVWNETGDTENKYHICTNTGIGDYQEWLEKCSIAEDNAYVSNKAVVYPNPTSGTAFVKLVDDYVTNSNITKVIYQLYKSNAELLFTFETDSPTEVIEIPENLISTIGAYYISCNIICNNPKLNEIIHLSFVVNAKRK